MTAASTWRTPLVIVLAGCLIAIISFGIRASFGVFLDPMVDARGWGREAFAFGLAVQNLVWGLGQPFFGAASDRYGPGRVLIAGGVMYALGTAGMAMSDTPLLFQLSAGILVGLGIAGASFTIVLAAFTRLLPETHRSWALGVGTAAGSGGQFLLVPLGQAFITAYGWHTALLLMAALALAVIPLSRALAVAPTPTPGQQVQQSLGEALSQAFRHPSYLLLTAGFFVCGFHVAFITVHLPPYIADLGLPPSLGAWSISLVGLFNIVGAYTSGMIGARYSKKWSLTTIYLARSVVIALFMMAPVSQWTVLAFAGAMGLLWLSTVPPTSGLVALMFGPRYMATLFGIVFLSHQIGSFTGVWLGGRIYEATGSYDLMWWVSIGLGIAAAIVHWPIRERPALAASA